MKIAQRLGFLLILIAAVLLAEKLIGAPAPLDGLDRCRSSTPPPTGIDPSLPAVTYNDTAISNLEHKLQKDANDWQSYQQLGFAYIQKARDTGDPCYYGRAEGVLQKALQLHPQDADSMVGLGSVDLSRHEFKEALDWGLKGFNIAPYNPRIFGVLTDAYTELGNYDGAVEAAQNMVNKRPDLSSYSRVSYQRELHGDMPNAIQAMQQAVEAGSPNAENTNWCRVQLGQLYWLQNDLAAAEKQYQQVLFGFPHYMYALAAMGQLRAAQGRLPEAADYYQQAIAIVPLPQYVTALGDIYTKMGKPEEARKQYDLFLFTAHLYEVNGVNFDIEKAIFLADHDMDLANALTLAQKAAAVRQDIHTQDSLAWVLYKNGKYADAQAASQKALRLGTADPILYFHAGMIASKLGDQATARADLQKALALNPQFHIFYAEQATTELRTIDDGR